VPDVQTPVWQVLAEVHELLSLQEVPFAATGFEHVPVAGLQVPCAWQTVGDGQTVAAPGTHAPF
jgi:hypothetical protein